MLDKVELMLLDKNGLNKFQRAAYELNLDVFEEVKNNPNVKQLADSGIYDSKCAG